MKEKRNETRAPGDYDITCRPNQYYADRMQKTLSPDVGCSTCTIRKQCDDISWRRDGSINPITVGTRAGPECLMLHNAHDPDKLIPLVT